MDVSVEMNLRLKNLQEPSKSLDTVMGSILTVVNLPGRGMGHKEIQEAPMDQPVVNQTWYQTEYMQPHLVLGILEDALAVVANTTFNPGQ